MPITIRSDLGPITTLDEWAAAVPAKFWRQRASSRALAEAWLTPGPRPAEPDEFAALLDSDRLAGLTLGKRVPDGTSLFSLDGAAGIAIGEPLYQVLRMLGANATDRKGSFWYD